MKLAVAYFALFLLASVADLGTASNGRNYKVNLSQALRDAGIVPNIICDPPKTLLEVTQGDVDVYAGTYVYPGYTAYLPTIYYETESDCLYTLLIIAVESSCPTVLAICTNIYNFDDLESCCDVSYTPPCLTAGDDPTTVVIVLYKQDGEIQDSTLENCSTDDFDACDFASNNYLEAVAINFYVTQIDDDIDDVCDNYSNS